MIKYAPRADRIKAREWFQSIPLQLAKENENKENTENEMDEYEDENYNEY